MTGKIGLPLIRIQDVDKEWPSLVVSINLITAAKLLLIELMKRSSLSLVRLAALSRPLPPLSGVKNLTINNFGLRPGRLNGLRYV